MPIGSVLSTGGDVVFQGGVDGTFRAFDANNGNVLWSFMAGSGFRGGPITYTAGGAQHVALPSRLGYLVMGLYTHLWPETADFPAGAAMIAFKIK